MRHLEHIGPRQTPGQEDRIDALLDVAHQQRTLAPELREQHDRHVVDAGSFVGRLGSNGSGVGPEHREPDAIKRERIAGPEPAAFDVAQPQRELPRGVAGTAAAHPDVERPADPVALEEQRESGDVILVRVRQQQQVDAAVPRRETAVERRDQSFRIRSAVDEHAGSARPLHEDGVTLSDIERDDPEPAVRAVRGQEPRRDDGHGERPERNARHRPAKCLQ